MPTGPIEIEHDLRIDSILRLGQTRALAQAPRMKNMAKKQEGWPSSSRLNSDLVRDGPDADPRWLARGVEVLSESTENAEATKPLVSDCFVNRYCRRAVDWELR